MRCRGAGYGIREGPRVRLGIVFWVGEYAYGWCAYHREEDFYGGNIFAFVQMRGTWSARYAEPSFEGGSPNIGLVFPREAKGRERGRGKCCSGNWQYAERSATATQLWILTDSQAASVRGRLPFAVECA